MLELRQVTGILGPGRAGVADLRAADGHEVLSQHNIVHNRGGCVRKRKSSPLLSETQKHRLT